MNRMLKWLAYLLLPLFLVVSCSVLKVKSEIRHLSGENTPVVDAAAFDGESGRIALENVHVLSPDAESFVPSQTVLIDNGIIRSVASAGAVPEGYTVVDGENKYLIPAFTDSHVHLYKSKNDLLLYTANGITQIAAMNSWKGTYLEWKNQSKEPDAIIPSMYIAAGPMSTARDFRSKVRSLFGPIPVYNKAKKARKAVEGFKEKGYDAIKSYTLEKEIYFAVSDATKSQDIPMIGHISPYIGLDDFLKGNQSQIAHVEEITKALEREFGGRSKIYYKNTEAFLQFVEERADEVARSLKDRQVAVATTALVYESAKQQDLNLEAFLKSIELQYVNPGILEGSVFNPGWLPGSNQYEDLSNTDSLGVKRAELYWNTYKESIHIMTRALVQNEVLVCAGTDANLDGIVPGFSLHDELEYLSKIGLSNAQILKTCTVSPALWLENNAGSIEVNKRADLVLLAGNPLDDISNTRTMDAVIIHGKMLNRKQLDAILAAVLEANNEVREINIDKYLQH